MSPWHFACGYVTFVAENVICLYAGTLRPHGVRGRWGDLWRQLCYRAPSLPRATARPARRR